MSEISARRMMLSGLCASLIGVGLSRFAYTPLIPALIAQSWFTPSQAAYLGAANLAGYLAGALSGRVLSTHFGATAVVRAMMVVATVAFFACASPLSFSWYFAWRVAAGVSGGVLMVVAAATVLAHVPQAARGIAGGVIFTGVGLGIVLSGTLVPGLLQAGLAETWCGLGLLALALSVLGWRGWPSKPMVAESVPKAPAPSGRAIKALYVEYALNAIGQVPHMVFLVDFVARGLDRGLAAGAFYWVLFGLGALCGPMLAGRLADRFGFTAMVRFVLLMQAAAVGMIALTQSAFALALSSIVIGASVPGIVPLVLGRVHELVPQEARLRAWGLATTAFALGQAVAGYGFSAIFAHGEGRYGLLFGLAAGALALAAAIDLWAARAGPAGSTVIRGP